jgi:hypothetical protein
MTVDEMQRHIQDLCDQYEIAMFASRKAFAVPAFAEIHIQPIRSEVTYATALHEIGHCRGMHQASRSRMVRERWAWRWARVNALVWTQRMESTAISSLEWYECAIRIGRESPIVFGR